MRAWTCGLLSMLVACGGAQDAPPDGAPRPDGGADADGGATADAQAPVFYMDDVLALLTDPSASVGAIDLALAEVAREATWPLHEGTRWLFARRWDGAPPDAALTGDWVGFATGALPATRSATGAHVYVLVDTGAGATEPSGLYKWWSGGGGYVAPPEATVYGYDEFGEYGRVAPPPTAHLQRFPVAAAGGVAGRTVRVRVPAGPPGRTLLLHDGQNVWDPDAFFGGWQADVALAAPAMADVLAVAVDNTPDRFDEYTHVADDFGSGTVGGEADAYLAFLDDEVLPRVRARYGVVAAGDSLALAGSSLGGLVSLYAAMTDDTRAGCVIAMSSTVGWGSFEADLDATLIERWAGDRGHGTTAISFDAGGNVSGSCASSDGDGVDDDADDSDNYCVNLQLHAVLLAAGYVDGVDVDFAWAPGAQHNEAAWRARLPARLAACAAMGWAAP
ncbi:MAG: alpha/beta hydrolase-fold protein [Kofleriaceae bacterium]